MPAPDRHQAASADAPTAADSSRWWRWAPLVAAPLLVWLQLPGLFNGRGFPAEPDIIQLEVVARRWFFDHLAHGELSFLSPASTMGIPLLAAPTYGILSPVALLHLVLTWPTAVAWMWTVNTLLFATGWTAALRRLDLSAPAAFGVPLVILASGPVYSGHAVATVDLASLAFTGWTVWAALRWLATRRRSFALAMGVFAAQGLIAGDPFVVPLALLLAAVLGWGAGDHRDERPTARVWIEGGLLGGAASVATGAPLLAGALEYVPLSPRIGGFPRYEAMAFHTPPARLPEIVSPLLGPDAETRARLLEGALNTDWWYPSLSFGVIGCALWTVGAWALLSRRRLAAVLVPLALVLALMTLGPHLALIEWLWEHVPPFSSLRFPERCWRYVALLALPVMGVGVATLQARARSPAVAWACGLAVCELLLFQPPAQVLNLEHILYPPPEVENVLMAQAQGRGVRVDVFAPGARIDLRHHGVPMLRAPDTTGSRTLRMVPARALTTPLTAKWLGLSHVIAPHLDEPARATRNAAYGLTGGAPLGPTGLALYDAGGDARRPLFAPRVEVAPSITAESVTDTGVPVADFARLKAALAAETLFVSPTTSLDAQGRLQPPPPAVLEQVKRFSAPRPGCEATLLLPAQLARDAARDSWRVQLQTPCAGLVSLPMRLLPGFRAELDGQPVPLVSVNDLNLGVFVDGGRATLTLRYRPAGPGLIWLMLLTVALTAALAGWERRRQRAAMPTPD